MKKLLIYLFVVVIISTIYSCSTEQNNNETLFYQKLDSLKLEYEDKPVSLRKRKYMESSDPITNVYAYTSPDRDNLAFEIENYRKYKLSIIQLSEFEYEEGNIDRNIMIHIESDDPNFSYQNGWISMEHIVEFDHLSVFLK